MFPRFLLCLGLLFSYQQATMHGQTYAVVIGISDYQALSYATGDLRFADRDAHHVATFLRSKAGGSISRPNLRLLTNRQATQNAIQKALELFRQAGPDDRIILYFSGHGLPDSFVPYDAQPGDQHRLLTYRVIKTAFQECKAKTKLCIADACLSGGITQQKTTRSTLSNNSHDSSSIAMMLASRSTQSAVEDGRLAGGAFTYFLLKGLTGKGDFDGNGIVTIRELHQYVATKVKERTKGRQTPIFYGRFLDTLPLSYL